MLLASRFRLYDGDDCMGLVRNENHIVFEWVEAKILFSATRHGGAMSCHFAADKSALRKVKPAIDEFVRFLFDQYEWCRMAITLLPSRKKSIERVIKKVGFTPFCKYDGGTGYMRCRDE